VHRAAMAFRKTLNLEVHRKTFVVYLVNG